MVTFAEYTLCGDALEGDHDEGHIDYIPKCLPTRRSVVTCPRCSEIISEAKRMKCKPSAAISDGQNGESASTTRNPTKLKADAAPKRSNELLTDPTNPMKEYEQKKNPARVGEATPARSNRTPDVGNVRNRDRATTPTRITQLSAFTRGVAAGIHEDETGELAECPYTLTEKIEAFWRGVRANSGAEAPPSPQSIAMMRNGQEPSLESPNKTDAHGS